MSHTPWHNVCTLDAILPGTGVCALVEGHQIALFRPTAEAQIYALDNIDPFAQASVLSRGLIGEHGGELWVASPLTHQRSRRSDGHCMENADFSVRAYSVRIEEGRVEVAMA